MRKANRWPCLIPQWSLSRSISAAHRASILSRILKSPLVNLTRALELRSSLRVVAGDYDPSVAPEAYTEDSGSLVDFIVRGEGESTFHELLCTVEMESRYERILGLAVRLKFYKPPRAQGLRPIKLPTVIDRQSMSEGDTLRTIATCDPITFQRCSSCVYKPWARKIKFRS